MSNLRSISEGSFVLGDTNGLTFEAGSGIKITEPSEGTVRISNDETVLWTGDATSATLSEPYTSFQYLEVYFDHHGPGYIKLLTALMGDNVSYSLSTTPTFTNSYGSIYLQSFYTPTTTEFKKRFICKEFYGNTGNVTAGNPSDDVKLRKIVGINRIGGNA